ncbi:MAG: hypothetical protein LC734_01170 [Acidobacteria bacterium]|nr:hypothetical protein [Acidobacteriota bacterium]
MHLDAVSSEIFCQSSAAAVGFSRRAEVYEPWVDWEPSQISHHGTPCCEIARRWLCDADFSFLNGGSLATGPRWLSQKFKWGASRYPIHWCEAVRRDTLDCGVLSAFAHEVLRSRGIRRFRTQFVQQFSELAGEQWATSWADSGASLDWIGRGHIYHEGNAVAVSENEIKIWDASAGWWVDSRTTAGYGSTRALKITCDKIQIFKWGEHLITANEWTTLA